MSSWSLTKQLRERLSRMDRYLEKSIDYSGLFSGTLLAGYGLYLNEKNAAKVAGWKKVSSALEIAADYLEYRPRTISIGDMTIESKFPRPRDALKAITYALEVYRQTNGGKDLESFEKRLARVSQGLPWFISEDKRENLYSQQRNEILKLVHEAESLSFRHQQTNVSLLFPLPLVGVPIMIYFLSKHLKNKKSE